MQPALKATVLSAGVLALAGCGDALLYALLPVNAAEMGVPFLWVGLLLSVNRFIRLASNHGFAWLFSVFGYRMITIAAAFFAALTTILYGLASTMFLWITARVVWGLCYSALRTSCLSYSLEGTRPGFQLGLNRGLQETGPIFALLVGPLLVKLAGATATFLMMGVFSLSAVILARRLPDLPAHEVPLTFRLRLLPCSFNLIVFVSSLVVDGFLVVVAGRLFYSEMITGAELTAIAAFYLGFRRLSNVLLSPLAGKIADRAGIERIFFIATSLTVLSLVLIAADYTSSGLLATFTFQGISSALSPGKSSAAENRLVLISANTTWRDLGSAAGALLGGAMAGRADLRTLLFIGAIILFLCIVRHLLKSTNNRSSLQGKWKWK